MVDVPVWSETASSNVTASPDGWPENMAPSGVNDSARENMAALRRFWSRINGPKTAGGSANAITCNFDVAEAAYYTGARTVVKLATTNTGAASLNLNALGAVTIKDIYGNDLVGGELTSGAYAEFLHNGTNQILIGTRYLGANFVWKKSLSGASVDFDPLPTGFARFDLNIYDLIAATDAVAVDIQFKVSSVQTTNYVNSSNTALGGANSPSAGGTAGVRLCTNLGNAAGEQLNALASVYNVDGTTLIKKMQFQSSWNDAAASGLATTYGSGSYTGGAGAVTGLRIITTSGNITSGTAVLVGHRFA